MLHVCILSAISAMSAVASAEEALLGYAADTDNTYSNCWDAPPAPLSCGWYCTQTLVAESDGTMLRLQSNGLPSELAAAHDDVCSDCDDFSGVGTIHGDNTFAQGLLPDVGVSFAAFYDETIQRLVITFDPDKQNVSKIYKNLCRTEYTILSGSVMGHTNLSAPLTQATEGAVLEMIAGTIENDLSEGVQPASTLLFDNCTHPKNKPYCTNYSATIADDAANLVTLSGAAAAGACASLNLVFTTVDNGPLPEPNYRGHGTDSLGCYVLRDGDRIVVARNGHMPFIGTDGHPHLFRCKAEFNVTSGCVLGLGPSEDCWYDDSIASTRLPEYPDVHIGGDFVIGTLRNRSDDPCYQPLSDDDARTCAAYCTAAFAVITTDGQGWTGSEGKFGFPAQAGRMELIPATPGNLCNCSKWHGKADVAQYGTVAQGAFANSVLFTIFLDSLGNPIMTLDTGADNWCYLEYRQLHPTSAGSLLVSPSRELSASVADADVDLVEVSRTGEGTDCSAQAYPACTAWSMSVQSSVANVVPAGGGAACPWQVAVYAGDDQFRGNDEEGGAVDVSVAGDVVVVTRSSDAGVCTVTYEVSGGCLLNAGDCGTSAAGGARDSDEADDGAVVALAVVAALLAVVAVVLGVLHYRLRKEMAEADASQHVAA